VGALLRLVQGTKEDGPVLAATRWKSNAELIRDLNEKLHYLNPKQRTLDPTYGKGTWWKLYTPPNLVQHDILLDGVDFRHLPEENESFDAIGFDPPYVSVGGRKTSTLIDFNERYGLRDAPQSPQLLQGMINEGLVEMNRVLAKRGVLLVKCQNYISSGKLWLGEHHTLKTCLDLGLECVEVLHHVGNVRAQPARARQVHARNNSSTMFVLRKPR
jgi:hypothetical protein